MNNAAFPSEVTPNYILSAAASEDKMDSAARRGHPSPSTITATTLRSYLQQWRQSGEPQLSRHGGKRTTRTIKDDNAGHTHTVEGERSVADTRANAFSGRREILGQKVKKPVSVVFRSLRIFKNTKTIMSNGVSSLGFGPAGVAGRGGARVATSRHSRPRLFSTAVLCAFGLCLVLGNKRKR